MQPHEYQVHVTNNEHLKDNKFLLQLTYPNGFRFLAGQFVMIKAIKDGKEIMRPYSIMSLPDEDHLLFYIKLFEQGQLTPILYNAKPGDEFFISGPFGNLTHQTIGIPEHIIFIGIGTGIAPIRPLVHYYAQYQATTKLTVIHQERYEQNLIFAHEFRQMTRYFPVLSKEKSKNALHGHFQDYVNKWFDKNATYVIVARRQIVNELEDFLLKRGVAGDFIFKERY